MFKRVLRFYSTDKDTKKGDFDEKVAAQSQDDDGLTMTQIQEYFSSHKKDPNAAVKCL